MTAWIVVTVVLKSLTSELIETFITDWSSTITNCAVASATSASHPFFADGLLAVEVVVVSVTLILLRSNGRPSYSPGVWE